MKERSILILFIFVFFSCITLDNSDSDNENKQINYREEMRNFIIAISNYSKGLKPGFIIIPQNGHELLTDTGTGSGTPSVNYINAIDGMGQESLFYGYDTDNIATPLTESHRLQTLLDIGKNNNVQALVTDYCSDWAKMDNSYSQNFDKEYISFAADQRELNNIPSYPSPINNLSNSNITTLNDAKNFLYLINPENYNKTEFLSAISNTNYDIILIDLYDSDGNILQKTDIDLLKTKKDGGTRLIISYISIGEAEDYRDYWNSSWETNLPSWIKEENPDWTGNYKVKYWESEWQDIIYGNDNSYIKKIINSGFDGIYLDIIDAFEYFEDQ